jgi:hypothetical protein
MYNLAVMLVKTGIHHELYEYPDQIMHVLDAGS